MPRCALACVLALVTVCSAAFAQPAANPLILKIDGGMIGGAAYGMPFQLIRLPAAAPPIIPPSIFTMSGLAAG